MNRRKKLLIIEIISTILFMICIVLIIVNGLKYLEKCWEMESTF